MNDIKLGLIGGTGMAECLQFTGPCQRHELETPFGRPSDAIVETIWESLPVLLLSRHGQGHTLSPSKIPFRANIFALKQLGCTHIIASTAVGSLRQEFKPQDLVIADQIIDKTYGRAGTFFENAAVHVEMSEPFCPVLRRILIEQGAKPTEAQAAAAPAAGGEAIAATTVHDHGCYLCMEGPAFSTRAESLMHRIWGGDLIGMTAMPEVKLAREAEIAYALVALVTDYDSWKAKAVTPGQPPTPQPETPPDPSALLKEIQGNLKAASNNAMELVRSVVRRIATDPGAVAGSPARQALKLAIWSDKAAISPEEVQRLAPLWGKYFG